MYHISIYLYLFFFSVYVVVCFVEYLVCVFFFKQKTAYEMRISDWSSDVCSSDLLVDGVSLTGNEVDGTAFGVNIIPHTAEVTTLGARQPGDRVNLEIDMLARYVQRLMAATAGAAKEE